MEFEEQHQTTPKYEYQQNIMIIVSRHKRETDNHHRHVKQSQAMCS